jgi:hypothetical protein
LPSRLFQVKLNGVEKYAEGRQKTIKTIKCTDLLVLLDGATVYAVDAPSSNTSNPK